MVCLFFLLSQTLAYCVFVCGYGSVSIRECGGTPVLFLLFHYFSWRIAIFHSSSSIYFVFHSIHVLQFLSQGNIPLPFSANKEFFNKTSHIRHSHYMFRAYPFKDFCLPILHRKSSVQSKSRRASLDLSQTRDKYTGNKKKIQDDCRLHMFY